MAPITPDMILTMVVLVFVILVFVFEWVRVDVVGIMMMVLLPLAGLISPKQAFVGLSSNAVCSIIAVIIIGAGLGQETLTKHLVVSFDPLDVDCGNVAPRKEHHLLTDEWRCIQDMRRGSLDFSDDRIRIV